MYNLQTTKKILVFGHAPLPNENAQRTFAPGKRTWQFVKPLLDSGYAVCLIAFRMTDSYQSNAPNIWESDDKNFKYYSLPMPYMYDKGYLKKLIVQFDPDYSIGVTTLPSSILARLELNLPFWADLYGSILAESQVKASTYQSDNNFEYFLSLEQNVLTVADKISTVSTAQRYAVIGELGIVGRLNSFTTGYEFVHSIPAGGEFEPYKLTQPMFRGKDIPNDAFVILFSGGYNTWVDINTLFMGIEGAMAQNDRIHFVSTGGAIEGHDDYTYVNFQKLIEKSAYRDRWHLYGWVEFDTLHNYYLESDIGVIADKPCYEAELGSRTRLIDWLRAGLPVVCNALSEVTHDVINFGAGFEFLLGDHEDLTQKILLLADDQTSTQVAQKRALQLIRERYSIKATMSPILDWVEGSSHHAPDYGQVVKYYKVGMSSRESEPFIESWYNLLQPVWSKIIFQINKSRFRFIIPILRIFSRWTIQFIKR